MPAWECDMNPDYDHGDFSWDCSDSENSEQCRDEIKRRPRQAPRPRQHRQVQHKQPTKPPTVPAGQNLPATPNRSRPLNMAAEIRTFVRTIGPAIFAEYRKLRAQVRQLGLCETEEALEFARQYLTSQSIMQYSELASSPDLDIDELSRCTKGAILCSRKHCFSAETCEPLHFSQFEHVWHSSHQAGVGKRLAVAFIQHFGLGMDALGKLGKQAASHSLLDALPRPAATQTTAHTSPHLHPHTTAQRPTYSLEPIAEHARRRCGEDMVKEEPNTPETPLMSPCDAPPFTSIQTINHISACEAGSPFSSISSETTDMTLGESCNTTSELAALPMVRFTSFQAVDKVQNFDDVWQTWGNCFFQDTPVSVY